MRYHVTLDGQVVEIDLTGARPRIDGTEVSADLVRLPGSDLYHLRVDGRGTLLELTSTEGRGSWQVGLGGRRLSATAEDDRARAIRAVAGTREVVTERSVTAPMPGLVVRVEVEVGQTVQAGTPVVVVEAMKMENELKAPGDGVVARIEVAAGQTVDRGAVLLVLE